MEEDNRYKFLDEASEEMPNKALYDIAKPVLKGVEGTIPMVFGTNPQEQRQFYDMDKACMATTQVATALAQATVACAKDVNEFAHDLARVEEITRIHGMSRIGGWLTPDPLELKDLTFTINSLKDDIRYKHLGNELSGEKFGPRIVNKKNKKKARKARRLKNKQRR